MGGPWIYLAPLILLRTVVDGEGGRIRAVSVVSQSVDWETRDASVA